jgi:hypothetical protein
MANACMQTIRACDHAVQHLVDRSHNDPQDRAARPVDRLLYMGNEGLITLLYPLAYIRDRILSQSAILPEPSPVLLLLSRGIETRSEKEWWIAGKDRLPRDGC